MLQVLLRGRYKKELDGTASRKLVICRMDAGDNIEIDLCACVLQMTGINCTIG